MLVIAGAVAGADLAVATGVRLESFRTHPQFDFNLIGHN